MRRKPRNIEHQIQVAIVASCKMMQRQYPELKCLMSIPNGGKRHIVTAVKMKREGQKPGASDLFLALPIPHGPAGFWIEVKSPDGVVSANQKDFMELMQWAGFKAIVCYGAQEGVDAIVAYLKVYRDRKTTTQVDNDLVFLRKQAD